MYLSIISYNYGICVHIITSKKWDELGDISAHNEVKVCALLRERPVLCNDLCEFSFIVANNSIT